MANHVDANQNWLTGREWDQIAVAVLCDIREELKLLRSKVMPLRHLECSNFLEMPYKLDRIEKNTRRPKRKRRVKA